MKVVYILALGHSGSTLLDMLLGTNEQCFSLGEIAKFQAYCEKKLRPCTCDFIKSLYPPLSAHAPKPDNYELCTFYQQVIARIGHVPLVRAENSTIRRRLALHSLLPGRNLASSTVVKDEKSEDGVFFSTIFETAKGIKPRLQYLVDSSKSLSRFFVLADQAEIELHCLFLTREAGGFINSYLKTPAPRGGYWYYLFIWLRRTILQARLLSRIKNPTLWVRYEDLARNPDRELERIADFLGISHNGDVSAKVRSEEYHIIGGNRMSTSSRSFPGVRYAASWQHELPEFQKRLGGFMQRMVYRYLQSIFHN